MKAYIIQISWTFRGESGHDTIQKCFLDKDKAQKHLQEEVLRDERENTWLCDVLDENLKPYPDVTLETYEYTGNFFMTESEEYEAMTEIWINDLEIV